MQEFSSISVSSYEAGSLADQLTEQSAAGWSVVAIVPTGSTVTAYLSRDADTSDAADSADTSVAADTGDTTGDTTGDVDTGAEATPEPVLASTTPEPAAEATPEPTAVSPGWAAGLETSTTAPTEHQADTEHFTVADEPTPEPAPEPAAEPAAEATPAAAMGTAGAAPAGWYADPSSRFELRYWDGSQWTEHVSRAGQQYTDPPVA